MYNWIVEILSQPWLEYLKIKRKSLPWFPEKIDNASNSFSSTKNEIYIKSSFRKNWDVSNNSSHKSDTNLCWDGFAVKLNFQDFLFKKTEKLGINLDVCRQNRCRVNFWWENVAIYWVISNNKENLIWSVVCTCCFGLINEANMNSVISLGCFELSLLFKLYSTFTVSTSGRINFQHFIFVDFQYCLDRVMVRF